MNVIGDFEIIRTSLLMGDIADVIWKIRSARKAAQSAFHRTKDERYSVYIRILDKLESVLTGKGKLSDLRAEFLSDLARELIPDVNMEAFSNTFLFYLEYALDRYNVAYPGYDEKRCGDK